MASIKHLFEIADIKNVSGWWTAGFNSDQRAPELFPASGKPDPQNYIPQLINVWHDFEWTHTPVIGRREVPYIRLSEQRVEFNSLVQNLRYMLTAAKEGLEGAAAKVPGGTAVSEFIQGTASSAEEMATGGNFNPFVKGANRLPTYLQPYHGLYGTSPTGFEYTFPYFEQEWKGTETSWSDKQPNEGMLSEFTGEILKNIPGDIQSALMFMPGVKGTAIEKPMHYQYKFEGPKKQFSFNLINTNRWEDVVKNWQLCFLLCYQNLPNKTSKVLMEPPVIYEVEIPGMFYMPFAYITSINITNEGAMRKMKVPVLYQEGIREKLNLPAEADASRNATDWQRNLDGSTPRYSGSGNPTVSEQVDGRARQGTGGVGVADPKEEYIETLVPDAYKITINLQSMIGETKNLYFHSTMGPATRNSGIYNVVVSNPDEFAHMEKSGSLASLHAQQDAKKKAAAAEAAKEE